MGPLCGLQSVVAHRCAILQRVTASWAALGAQPTMMCFLLFFTCRHWNPHHASGRWALLLFLFYTERETETPSGLPQITTQGNGRSQTVGPTTYPCHYNHIWLLGSGISPECPLSPFLFSIAVQVEAKEEEKDIKVYWNKPNEELVFKVHSKCSVVNTYKTKNKAESVHQDHECGSH